VGLEPQTIVVVDADPTDRHRMALLLKSWGHQVVGRAEGAKSAFAVIGTRRPQVAVIGMPLLDAGGMELVQGLLSADPGLGIVLVLGQVSTREIDEAMASGARRIVLRGGGAAELASAVATAASADPE
jgi:DNA-binding NarL/FixJ family response regulator